MNQRHERDENMSDDEPLYDSEGEAEMPNAHDRLNNIEELYDEAMVYESEEDMPNHNDQHLEAPGADSDDSLVFDSEGSNAEEVEVWESNEESEPMSEGSIEPDPYYNILEEFFYLNIEGGGLDDPLLAQGNMREFERLLLEIAKALRYRHSYVSMLASFEIANIGFDNAYFPTTMQGFWKMVNRNLNHFKRSIACTICWEDLGIGKKPNRVCRCGESGPEKTAQLGTFLYLNLPVQLQGLLAKRGMARDLEYPWTRVKRDPDAIEDVYDGSLYRELSADGAFLSRGKHNYSLAIWTDGVDPVISAAVTIWPVFVQVLELSPRARQRNSLLAALYVGPRKPQMAKFLTPFTTELRDLYLNGITWRPDGVVEVTSRFTTLILSADSEARYSIMGMMRHNAHNGCTYCYAQGERVGDMHQFHIYRYHDMSPENANGFAADRTDDEIRRDATIAMARADNGAEKGVRAISALSIVPGIDLRRCQLIEALHCLWERNFTRLYTLLVSPDIENYITQAQLAEISHRIQLVKPPTKIARYPRPLEDFAKYKGTEYRNLAWYYWLPCAHDFMTQEQIEYCSLFIDATYILNKDSISLEELNIADRKIDEYRRQSEHMFEARHQTYSLHLLKHVIRSVRDLGPLWVASGFWFESLNRQVKNYLTSPTDRAMQVACRILLAQMVEKCLDWDLSPDVMNLLRRFLLKAQWVAAPEVATGRFTRHARGVPGLLDEQEIAALEEAGYDGVREVTKHKKVCIDGVCYQPKNEKPVKYDNSVVHVTPPNVENRMDFIRIMSIIKWQNGNELIEGVIGHRFITVGEAFNTSYMKIVQESQALVYLPLRCINAPAVLVESAGRIYVSPIPNRWDVD